MSSFLIITGVMIAITATDPIWVGFFGAFITLIGIRLGEMK